MLEKIKLFFVGDENLDDTNLKNREAKKSYLIKLSRKLNNNFLKKEDWLEIIKELEENFDFLQKFYPRALKWIKTRIKWFKEEFENRGQLFKEQEIIKEKMESIIKNWEIILDDSNWIEITRDLLEKLKDKWNINIITNRILSIEELNIIALSWLKITIFLKNDEEFIKSQIKKIFNSIEISWMKTFYYPRDVNNYYEILKENDITYNNKKLTFTINKS